MMATTTSHHSSSLLVQAQFDDFADFFRPASPPPPTSSPVPGNTPPPPAPTLARLSVFQSSFASGETISVSYDYTGATMSPQLNDRIAFYPIGQDPLTHTPTTYLFWCGRQVQCQGVPPTDGLVSLSDMTVPLEHRDPSNWMWPIPSGNYQVFLLRGHNPPFQILGQASQTIEVRSNPHLENVVPAVQAIEREIRQLISATPTLGPKFVRLSFHDCAGGCNGCVDMTFPDNAGLHIPIDALRPIVNRHENPSLGISRADIWALAAHIGADMAQAASPTKADFHMEFIGRQNCENVGQPCLDANGNPRECRDTLGPHVHLPEADTGTEELFHFFSSEFGFDVQETVALMGAHTLGSLNKTHSGFDAPNGWVRDNTLLDNDYYHELIGPRSNLVDLAPPWHRFRFDNSDLPGIPNKPAWRALPPAFDRSGIEEIFMLNVDVSTTFNVLYDAIFHTLLVSRYYTFTFHRSPWYDN